MSGGFRRVLGCQKGGSWMPTCLKDAFLRLKDGFLSLKDRFSCLKDAVSCLKDQNGSRVILGYFFDSELRTFHYYAFKLSAISQDLARHTIVLRGAH